MPFSELKQVEKIEHNRYAFIHVYHYQGKPYTGNATSKGKYGTAKFSFEDGKKHGLQWSFYESGERKRKMIYDDGLLIELWSYFKDGGRKNHMLYNNGN